MAGFFKSLINRFTKPNVDWDELEAALIGGDLGPRLTMEIVDELQGRGGALRGEDIVDVARRQVREVLPHEAPVIRRAEKGPTVLLIVGVNGTGKTTSTAKLARLLTNQGSKVVLAAADTFRAAAVEQLQTWGERLGVPVVSGPPNSDPAAVCFDAQTLAAREEADFLLCDTAGRLHTKHNLMEELKKVHRTLAKQDATAPHEVILVVDATTGSNALQQAKEFNKAVPVTGLIVTKLDGSGKGGVLVTIQQELGIPTFYVGMGERADDLKAFEPESFVKEVL